jgi:hypothetical protein
VDSRTGKLSVQQLQCHGFLELADALRAVGRFDEALTVAHDALHRSERTGERQFAAELYRIAGATLIKPKLQRRRTISGRNRSGKNARCADLGTAGDANLAVLLGQQGKRAEARAMLAEVLRRLH